MTLDEYCNSSASDRFRDYEEPEPQDIDAQIDYAYELYESLKEKSE